MDRTSGKPGGAKELFHRGPKLSVEDFSIEDFSVRDFIDNLIDEAAPANRRSGPLAPAPQQTFDPKPLIRTFEYALSQLETLSEDLQLEESELASQVRRAEIDHNQTVEAMGRKLEQSIAELERLDSALNNAAMDDIIQKGKEIEEAERRSKRAQDAILLIECWTELRETGQVKQLESILRQGRVEHKARVAAAIRWLKGISQRLDAKSWDPAAAAVAATADTDGEDVDTIQHDTRQVLEKLSEALEQDLLKHFNNSYRQQSFDDMMESAKVLHDVSGGASVIATFVNQHQFFIDRKQLLTDEVTGDAEYWDQLADPDADPVPGVEPSLKSLVDEVKAVMQDESFIIKRAFPFPDTVLVKFVQRVFQQSIQQRLEQALTKAASVSPLAFLRSLHASKDYIDGLVEELKAHGLTEHPEPCSAHTAQMLDHQMEELFVPYLVGNYMDQERRFLEDMFASLLLKFTTYHEKRKKSFQTSFMAAIKAQGSQLLATTKDSYLETLRASDRTPVQKALMLQVAGIQEADSNRSSSPTNSTATVTGPAASSADEIAVTLEDGVVSRKHWLRIVTWVCDSVRRTLDLKPASERPADAIVYLNLLLHHVGQLYVTTALDAALDAATAQKTSKSEPDLSYLPSLRPALLVATGLDRLINSLLVAIVQPNIRVQRSIETQTHAAMQSYEKKTSAILRATLELATNWVSKTLATQKKLDFSPRDLDLKVDADSLQTTTCTSTCAFLDQLGRATSQAVDGGNLAYFTALLVPRITTLLFEHFKKWPVNAAGALMVTRDVAKYAATLRAWGLEGDADAVVELLTEVSHLFIMGPVALRERSRELCAPPQLEGAKKAARRGVVKLSWADFKAFVKRREDSGSGDIQRLLVEIHGSD